MLGCMMGVHANHDPSGIVALATKPLRVLHLFPRFRPNFAGDGLYFEKLWPKLQDLEGGHDVAVFTTPAPADIPRVVPAGAALYYFRGDERQSQTAVLLRYYLWLLRNIRRYSAIHSRTHVDRYFVSHFIAKLFGVAMIYSATLDDSPPYIIRTYRPSLWRFVSWAMRKTLTRLVVINKRLYDDSVPLLGASRVTIIPQGVDPPPDMNGDPASDRAGLRKGFGIPENAFVLLYVGSVSRRKDVLFLIENLAGSGTRERHLILLGPELEEDYRDEIHRRVAELGLEKRVHFPGYRDDPAPFYRLADVFVFASWLEGFPNVLGEAMACGLPILARRLEGVTDFVIANGETGILFDTAAEYRAALDRLETQPEFAARLGKRARAKAAADYSLDEVARRYIALYREAAPIR